jgi:hypothetical protein
VTAVCTQHLVIIQDEHEIQFHQDLSVNFNGYKYNIEQVCIRSLQKCVQCVKPDSDLVSLEKSPVNITVTNCLIVESSGLALLIPSLLLYMILSKFNAVHIPTMTCFPKVHFNIIFPSPFIIQVVLSKDFPIKIQIKFFFLSFMLYVQPIATI